MIALLPALYVAAILAVGLAHRRAVASEADFFVARRSGGFLLLTGSLLATMFGSFGLLGVSGRAASMGLVAAWFHWVGAIGLLVLAGWAVRRIRLDSAYSLPELMGQSYGKPVRIATAGLIALAWLGVIAAQLIAAGKVLAFMAAQSGNATLAAISVPAYIAGVTVLFAAYTCLGGQHSVLRTDLIQASILFLSLVALVVIVLLREPGVLAALPEGSLALPFNEFLRPSEWIILALTFGAPFLVGPDIVGRLFCGRDGNTARRAVFAAAVLMIPAGLFIALAGVLGGAMASDAGDADMAILWLASDTLPAIGTGLMVAALLAAVMSSADTCLITVSTLVSRDLADSAGFRPRTESAILWRGRIIVVVAAAFAFVLAIGFQDIFTAIQTSYRLYAPAVLVPFVVMLCFRAHRFHPGTGIVAVALGGLTAAWGVHLGDPRIGYVAFLIPLVPLAADLLRRRSAGAGPHSRTSA